MRLFLIWPDSGPEINSLIAELEKHAHKLIYWVGAPAGEKDKPAGTIFHSYVDAFVGRPAPDIDPDEFMPPGAELIKKMQKTESLILSMMNRGFDKLCVDERRHIYYELLRYWYGVLEKFKPEVIIFPITPHFTYDYLIYELAHLLNIKTIMFLDTKANDRLFQLDFWSGSAVVQKELRNNQGRNFQINDLSHDLQEYYLKQTSAEADIEPLYIKLQRNQYSFLNWFLFKLKTAQKSLKRFTIFRDLAVYLFKVPKVNDFYLFKKELKNFAARFKNNLKKEYERLQVEPDLDKKFIYVPIQRQPERTTSPQGDMFVDQILMIETLAASIPADWVIYAKEHLIQWPSEGINFSSCRYQGYYERIAKIKNVYLIPIKTNSFLLIRKSQAVTLVTGSAGWEASLRSKPAIAFGYPWYQDLPGLLRVNSADSCREAVKKIINGYKMDQQNVINYLKAFEKATIHGYIADRVGRCSKLTKQQSMDNITQAILREIEEYAVIK